MSDFNKSYFGKKLYLASSSKSRQYLLDQIKINYEVIEQNYDESSFTDNLPIDELVLQLAVNKMECSVLGNIDDLNDNIIYVLSADTLSEDMDGKVHGKPKDYNDAVNKIKKLRKGSFVYTAFCLDKKIYENGFWKTLNRKTCVIFAKCIINIPDKFIDIYLDNTIAMKSAGAIVIDEFGLQFLKSIDGSYTAIIGLPLFELRQALEELGFYN